ncbi:MAG: YjgP/YjgQ family permease [Meiothermus sp.]
MTRLDFYLLREVGIYLVGALAAVIMALLAGALYEVLAPLLQRGADPLVVGQYLAFKLPELVVRALPLAFLFGLLLVFSRLGEDSELKAMLAGGVGKARVLLPMLMFAGVLFIVGIVLAETLVPRGLQKASSVLREAVVQKPRALLSPGTRFEDAYGRIVYVGEVNSDNSIGQVRVITAEEILVAPRGRFEGGSLVLDGGLRVTYGSSKPRTVATFARGTVPLVELGFDPPGGLNNLSIAELRERVRQYRSQGFSYQAELTTLYRKFAEPAASFAFALFAVGVAFFLLGGSRSLGFVGVAVLSFLYYATTSVGRIMGEQGVIPAWSAAFGPGLIYALAGLVLLRFGRR